MKTTVTEHDFKEAFRSIRPDNFSWVALGAMFEWLEQYEEDTGEEFELDVIALCCDFSEYTIEELQQDYGYLLEPFTCPDCDQETSPFLDTCECCKEGIYSDDHPHTIEEWAEYLNDHTVTIEVDSGRLIVQAF